jgi:hypothetical protein
VAPTADPSGGVRPPADHVISGANSPVIAAHANSGSSRAAAPPAGGWVWSVEDSGEIDAPSLRDQLAAAGSLTRSERAAVSLPSRAETLEQARQEPAEQAAPETTTTAEKPKKRKRKKTKQTGVSDLKETLTLVACVSVVVAVLGFLAWRFPDFRYPLGGLLVVIGFVLYWLGAGSLRELAAREGFLKSMAYRFFPPYQLWYVMTRWEETRDYFAFFASGLLIMAIGVGVVTTSDSFRKAEDSERAYQEALDEWVRGSKPKPPPPPVMKKSDNANK